jgi:c-di-GMP-binding flagellar brake protein YcgR
MEGQYFAPDRLLELKVGSVVQVNSETEDFHFTVRLVGIDQGHTVVTTLPLRQNLPEGLSYDSIFSEGTVFEMRTIHKGNVMAFESTALALYNNRLLMSSYPEMVETRRLRKESRFPCALSCDIHSGPKISCGVISNISHGGCQLAINNDHNIAIIEESLLAESPILLEVFFPDVEDSIIISALVRSASCQVDGCCKVGLAFSAEYECIRKYLESLQLDSVAPFFF